MFDLITFGGLIVEFIRPELDIPLDKPGLFMGPFPSGASAITISTAARLGLNTAFIGIVGDDFFGKYVFARLETDGVSLNHVLRVPGMPTGIAFVSYKRNGTRSFNYVTDYSKVNLNAPELNTQSIEKSKWIHTNGTMLGKRSIWKSYGKSLIEKTLHEGGNLSFDPNFRPELIDMKASRILYEPYIRMCRHFMPSEEEILAYFETNSLEKAIDLALELGPDIVCVKRGDKGCIVASQREAPIEVPAFSVNCIDPTGAGDCFDAGFIFAQERGLSLWESALFANAVGAFAVSQMGPMEGSPYLYELEPLFQENEDLKSIFNKLKPNENT